MLIANLVYDGLLLGQLIYYLVAWTLNLENAYRQFLDLNNVSFFKWKLALID